MKKILVLICTAFLFAPLGVSTPSLADEMDDPETEDMSEDMNEMFLDRDRLSEIVLRDEDAEEEALQEALDNGDITQEEYDAAIMELDDERTATSDVIDNLSDEQVSALNQFLNDSYHNGRVVNLDAEQLQAIIDDEYSTADIKWLTKGLEEEAKFSSFADRAEEKADETGNDKFLDQADRFDAKAESQKTKFHDRIEATTESEMEETMSAVTTESIKQETKDTAKGLAKQEAKDEARGQAVAEARKLAKETAKEAAKENAKEEAKSHAKGHN